MVVDFWAEWCGPCKSLTPVLEAATAERGRPLAKVDVDANQELAEQFGIRGIPAVKAFRNGEVVAEFVGAQSRPAVDAFLDELTKPPVAETVDDRRSPRRCGRATTSARSSSCSRASAPSPSGATRPAS